jgi:hypothetical protein
MGRHKKVSRCANDGYVAATGGKLAAPFWGFLGKQIPFQATSRAPLKRPRIFAPLTCATKKLLTQPVNQREPGHLSIVFADWNGYLLLGAEFSSELFENQPLPGICDVSWKSVNAVTVSCLCALEKKSPVFPSNYCWKIGLRCGVKTQQVEHDHEHPSANFGNWV